MSFTATDCPALVVPGDVDMSRVAPRNRICYFRPLGVTRGNHHAEAAVVCAFCLRVKWLSVG